MDARDTGIILETERLVLRKFTLEDTKFIIKLLNSPGWIEFVGTGTYILMRKQGIIF